MGNRSLTGCCSYHQTTSRSGAGQFQSPRLLRHALIALAAILASGSISRLDVHAGEPGPSETPAERGYHWLTTKTYLPADFDQEVFDNLWKVWPAELREKARDSSPEDRRRMTFARYGLAERPEGDDAPTALGYVPDGHSGWVMN